jgi:hypothetical protein
MCRVIAASASTSDSIGRSSSSSLIDTSKPGSSTNWSPSRRTAEVASSRASMSSSTGRRARASS